MPKNLTRLDFPTKEAQKEEFFRLPDGTALYDLLEKKSSITQLKNKYTNMDVVALRIHGLVGDAIKATTVLSPMLKENLTKRYVILQSYNDATKRELVKDIFSDLVGSRIVVGLYLNEYNIVGDISYHQYAFLRELGVSDIVDLYYHSSDAYRFLKKGIAYLGFSQPKTNNNKVALLRFSGFHQHVPLRHIKEEEWLDIEDHLLKLGLDVCLYGYDDTMSTLVPKEKDFRKQLTVLGTIKHAADSGLCISTTTYLPHYLHHFVPCLVYIDPVDTVPISLMWRCNHNFMPVNTQMSDHVDFVKDYVTMWRAAFLRTILKDGVENV